MQNSFEEITPAATSVNISPEQVRSFVGKLDNSKSPIGCWEWQATRFVQGYGQFILTKSITRAHRIAWLVFCGDIPPKMEIRHYVCGNKSCCNPFHLMPGTQKENKQDGIRLGEIAEGHRNGSHTHPEKVPCGDRHGSHTKPDKFSRGDNHYARTRPQCLARGVNHGNSKLTDEIVIETRKKYESGQFSQMQLAKSLGIAQATLWSILKRKSWRHVK